MKKLLLTLVIFATALHANAEDPIQCPYPTTAASVGLNQVDRASMGVFVYGQDNYGTQQSWTFEAGILPTSLTNQQAIATANTDLVSMGKILGPFKDKESNGVLCVYYSYMTQLMAVAVTGFSTKNIEQLILQRRLQ